MSRIELETWDSGRMTVNSEFVELFRQHGWTTFSTIWSETADAAVAKKMRTDRITLRFTIPDGNQERAFYIKRHTRSSWIEVVKPLLRLTWPILGARNEWNALLHFHEVGLPTMTPVAVGRNGSQSFLITAALEDCTKLSELNLPSSDASMKTRAARDKILRHVARLARKMHLAKMHHQDFYLGHLMQSHKDPKVIYIIDLGRVQKQCCLCRRWIVKDLAQLNFSAEPTPREQLRFMREYLGGQRLTRRDRRLMKRIRRKTASIARHSQKNRL